MEKVGISSRHKALYWIKNEHLHTKRCLNLLAENTVKEGIF